MSIHLAHQEPSAVLRRQIEAVSCRMDGLFRERKLYAPIASKRSAELRGSFTETESEAYLCCDVMDDADSTENKGRASRSTSSMIDTLSGMEGEMVKSMAQETKEPK